MELPPVSQLRQNLEAARNWWVSQGGDPADIDNAILADNQDRMAREALQALELERERLAKAVEFSTTPLVYESPPQSNEERLDDLENQITNQQQTINDLP